ncbi:MAG: dihydrofolate reductase [Deltaproteobacteria bacterium]|nr:dihydrofolate reductase [Deltaproteobacteria bacterium]
MIFEQLVCADRTRLTPDGIRRLRAFSRAELRCYPDDPATETELLARIGDADGVLVGWQTRVSGAALRAAFRLKYVGMCCSLYDAASANVDIGTARELGIEVRGVRDYGDEGVAEFVLAELISLFKGLGAVQWGKEPSELKGKTLGIIGFGTTGRMVAEAAGAFGMKILYFSRTRRPECEGQTVQYAPLMDLLSQADAVTTHLPRNTRLLEASAFAAMKPGAVLVNTSIGPTFDLPSFCDWIGKGGGHAVFDADGSAGCAERIGKLPGVRIYGRSCGFTAEARSRLTEKVIENIRSYTDERNPAR